MAQPAPKHLIFDLDGTLYSTENGYEGTLPSPLSTSRK